MIQRCNIDTDRRIADKVNGLLFQVGFLVWYDKPLTRDQRKIAEHAISLARDIGDRDTIEQLRLSFGKALPKAFE